MTERTEQEAKAERKQEKRRTLKFLWPIVIVIVPLLFALPEFVTLPRQIAFSACLLLIAIVLVTEYAVRRIRQED